MTPKVFDNPLYDLNHKGTSRSNMASEKDAVFAAIVDKYLQEGYDLAMQQVSGVIQEKDSEIERLKREIAKLKKTHVSAPSDPPPLHYNKAFFPSANGDDIIYAIIELTRHKREKGKFILSTKTDWYIIWRILHYLHLYIGSPYEFIDIVNDCVLPYIEDATRRDALTVAESNFRNITKDNPIRKVPVDCWHTEFEKEYTNLVQSKTRHGKLALDRAVNIMVELKSLLLSHGVDSRILKSI